MTFVELYQTALDMQRRVKNGALSGNGSLAQGIEGLNQKLQAYFTKDNEGKFPEFDTQGLNALLDDLGVISKGLKEAQGSAAEDLRQNVSDISLTLAQIDPTKGGSLPECVDDVGHLSISSGPEKSVVGANASSRQMLNVKSASGKEAQGFFTEEEKLFQVEEREKYENMLRQAMKDHPEDKVLQDFFGKVLSHPRGVYSLFASTGDYARGVDFSSKGQVANDIASDGLVFEALNMKNNGLISSEEEFDAIFASSNVQKALTDWRFGENDKEIDKRVKKSAEENLRYGKNEGYGLDAEAESSISGRNVAMSRVANVLGIPNLLARTTPVTMEREGKTIKGVLMEKAEGWDLPSDNDDGIKKAASGPFADLPENAFDGEGLKSLADLQVLDFICQNVDRHNRNMFYQFDDAGKLKSVMGIDNDLSFGTKDVPDKYGIQNGTGLDMLGVVSESMAKRLETMTPEMLAASLQGTGLKEKEIQAACHRLEKVQNRLADSKGKDIPEGKKAEVGILRVVPDAEWKDLKIQDLCVSTDEKNIFDIVKGNISVVNKIKEYKAQHPEEVKAAKEKKAQEQGPKFVDSQEMDELDPKRLQEKMTKMKEFREKLRTTEGFFRRTGTQYKAMTAALDHMLETPLPTDRELTDAERQMYDTRLDKLNEAIQGYVDYKAPRGDTGFVAETRLATAQELSSFAKDHLEGFRTAALEKEEKELAEAYQEYKQEQLAQEQPEPVKEETVKEEPVKEEPAKEKTPREQLMEKAQKAVEKLQEMGIEAKGFNDKYRRETNADLREKDRPTRMDTMTRQQPMFYAAAIKVAQRIANGEMGPSAKVSNMTLYNIMGGEALKSFYLAGDDTMEKYMEKGLGSRGVIPTLDKVPEIKAKYNEVTAKDFVDLVCDPDFMKFTPELRGKIKEAAPQVMEVLAKHNKLAPVRERPAANMGPQRQKTAQKQDDGMTM